MLKTHTESRDVQVVDALVCDDCGLEARPEGESALEFQEFVRLAGTGGFGSVIGDGVRWTLDLCQHCLARAHGPHIRIADTPDGDASPNP